MLSTLKYGVFYEISVGFIFIVKAMIIDLINLLWLCCIKCQTTQFSQVAVERRYNLEILLLKILPFRRVLVSLCVYTGEENFVSTLGLSLLSFLLTSPHGKKNGKLSSSELTIIWGLSVLTDGSSSARRPRQ